MRLPKLENTADVGILIVVLMLLGLVVTWPLLGQWEALRGFGVEILILAVTFYIARQYLPWEDAERERIRRPSAELWLGLAGFVGFYIAWPFLVDGGDLVIFLGPGILAALTLAALRYGRGAWGLRWPTGRELLVTVVVAALAIGLSRLFGGLLPASEAAGLSGPERPLVPGVMLDFSGAGANLLPAVLITLATVVGFELYFRVFLQTRLAQVLPGRWALFAQAALYFAACLLPLLIVTRGSGEFPPAFVLTQAAILSNGVLAGYFWRKTGSLPLLVLLHLLAFVRWGL